MTREERNSAIVDVLRKIMWLPDKLVYGFHGMCCKLTRTDFSLTSLKEGIYGMLFGGVVIALPIMLGMVNIVKLLVG